MDIIQFAKLVEEMRQNQRDFFRTHSSSILKTAKSLENKVDKTVSEILGDKAEPKLFNE